MNTLLISIERSLCMGLVPDKFGKRKLKSYAELQKH